MIKSFFITGTDTNSGKTLICGLLGDFLRKKGYSVVTQKWVQTGAARCNDVSRHLRLMNAPKKNLEKYLSAINPYCFKFAFSPHLASKLENKKINPEKIINSYWFLEKRFDAVLVEGTGGVAVPFAGKSLLIDIVKKLRLPVIVVSDNRLGAINKTILTVEYLRQKKLVINGIIYTNANTREDKKILTDNPKIITKITGEKNLGVLNYSKSIANLKKNFYLIGEKITNERMD